MKIIYEREKCIGCGSCVSICPEYFQMGDDGKAELKGSKVNPDSGNYELEIEEVKSSQEASSSCPVGIIVIE